LAASKLQIPVAHVEAGMRSYRRDMAEEVNRLVTDHLATALYCSSEGGRENLTAEGITKGVEVTGDVMHDALLWQLTRIRGRSSPLSQLGLADGAYALATVHRAENTDDPDRLQGILQGLAALAGSGLPVVMPLHPRTRKALGEWTPPAGVHPLEPLSFEEMLIAESNARVIVTDSGGVQKEAYWLGVPCVTVRDETEWVELIDTGWNTLVGADPHRLVGAALAVRPDGVRPALYGSGDAAPRIVASLASGAALR
jgi:UDP-N-acetylglucosamine 2-epimerase